MRSIAQNRFTAVGRVAANVRQRRSKSRARSPGRRVRAPSAMPMPAATPIAGAPRIDHVLDRPRHLAVVAVDPIDLALRQQPLVDHDHAPVSPFDGPYLHRRRPVAAVHTADGRTLPRDRSPGPTRRPRRPLTSRRGSQWSRPGRSRWPKPSRATRPTIEAGIDDCVAVLLDFERYPEWSGADHERRPSRRATRRVAASTSPFELDMKLRTVRYTLALCVRPAGAARRGTSSRATSRRRGRVRVRVAAARRNRARPAARRSTSASGFPARCGGSSSARRCAIR